MLIAKGILTVVIAHASKGKTVTLPRTINHFTGRESLHSTGFNDAAWGKPTRSYATSARSLTNAKFNDIIEGAQQFVILKGNHACNKTAQAAEAIDVDDDDEWAHLDISDDDCKSF